MDPEASASSSQPSATAPAPPSPCPVVHPRGRPNTHRKTCRFQTRLFLCDLFSTSFPWRKSVLPHRPPAPNHRFSERRPPIHQRVACEDPRSLAGQAGPAHGAPISTPIPRHEGFSKPPSQEMWKNEHALVRLAQSNTLMIFLKKNVFMIIVKTVI